MTPERCERTHTLLVEVPLHLARAAEFDYDAIYETLRVVLSVSRMAADGALCDDINVSLHELNPTENS